MLDYRNTKNDAENQERQLNAPKLDFWTSICPKCGGPAVYREIDERVVGACCSTERRCWWTT